MHGGSLTLMRRSSFFSAVVIALTLGTASTAFAAHPGDEVTPQDAHPNPPADAAEPPASEPAAGQPAVTIGTPVPGAPVRDTPQESAKENAARPKPRPFAGSSLFVANSMTTGTVFRGQMQYNDPTVESAFYLTPRYAINDAWQLRGRVVLNYEWTNNDENTYAHEPTLSDTTLSLYYRQIPSFAGIQPAVGANLTLPTSKPSRARTMVVAPGITGQLVRSWEHFLGGELDVIGALTYTHPFYRARNPVAVDDYPYPFDCLGGTGCTDSLNGTMNVSDILSYSFIVSADWGKWNPAFAYLGSSAWAYHPTGTVNPVDGTPIHETAGFGRTNLRQTHYLSVWLDYNFTPWITGEVGYWNAVSGIGIDGQQSNIFFDRYQDTRVYLGASFQLDNLVKALQGGEEGQAGVVRAETKPPMWTF